MTAPWGAGRARWSWASACPAEGRTFAALSSRVAVFSPPSGQQHRLQWFDGRGTARAIASEPGDYWQVRLSPDDRQAAVTMLEPLLRTLDVYVLRGGSGAPVPVTLGLAADTDPVWSPDGRTLLFRSVRNGQARLFTREVGTDGRGGRAAAGGAGRRGLRQHLPSEWSRAGEILFSATAGSRPNTDVFRVPAEPARTRGRRGHGLQRIGRPPVAGRPLGGLCADESGQPDVYVSGWPQGPRDTRQPGGRIASAVGGRVARTSCAATRCCAPSRQPGAAPVFDVPQRVLALPGIRDFDVAHAGDRLLVIVPAASARPPDVGAMVDWPSALAVFP